MTRRPRRQALQCLRSSGTAVAQIDRLTLEISEKCPPSPSKSTLEQQVKNVFVLFGAEVLKLIHDDQIVEWCATIVVEQSIDRQQRQFAFPVIAGRFRTRRVTNNLAQHAMKRRAFQA